MTDVNGLRGAPTLLLAFVLGLGSAMDANAAPVAATGWATAADVKKNAGPSETHAVAVRRARAEALTTAIEGLDEAVDAQARKAVLGQPEAWTGAYRILETKVEGDKVGVTVEVEVDLLRLAKRLQPPLAPAARVQFTWGEVKDAGGCGPALRDALMREVEGLGAVRRAASGTALSLELRCAALGDVPHTGLQAARIEASVVQGKNPMVEAGEIGLGRDLEAALGDAMLRTAATIADRLALRPTHGVTVRIVDPLPSAQVRRFERTVRDRVRGVRTTAVVGVEAQGAVRLWIEGPDDPRRFAKTLEGLSWPGFSVVVGEVDSLGAITLRFDAATTAAPGEL